MSNDITIFLHRYFVNGKSEGDDKIIIRKQGEDSWLIKYEDPTAKDCKPMICRSLSRHSVMHYAENLVKIVQADQNPFEYLQLTPPMMPSVLFKIKLSEDDVSAFLNAVSFTLKHWPVPVLF